MIPSSPLPPLPQPFRSAISTTPIRHRSRRLADRGAERGQLRRPAGRVRCAARPGRRGQDDAVPRAQRPGAPRHRRRLSRARDRGGLDTRDGTYLSCHRPLGSCFRIPRRSSPRCASRTKSRSGPRTWASHADEIAERVDLGARRSWADRIPRPQPFFPLGRREAARGDRRRPWPCARRCSSSTSRPQTWTRRQGRRVFRPAAAG